MFLQKHTHVPNLNTITVSDKIVDKHEPFVIDDAASALTNEGSNNL